MKPWFAPGFLIVLVLAMFLRLPDLSLRPLHNDEGVNAIKFRELWTANNYKYDPNEFHGPTLPYFTLPIAWLSGRHNFNDFTEATFRFVPYCFGLGLILLLLLLTPELGRAETLAAAVFCAVSPAMIYYSRDYIHETLLVFFTALAAIAWWRCGRSGRLGWGLVAGAAFGLMWATKETFVFSVLAFVLATLSASGWTRWLGPRTNGVAYWPIKTAATSLFVAFVVAALFFSSFLTNFSGLADAIKTYGPWLHRAEGVSPHVHPWYFYLTRLLWYHADGGPHWSEGFVVALAAVGFFVALAGRGASPAKIELARLIAFYTFWLALIYTVLPYKTPWCLLNFYFGMILLAGIGAGALLSSRGFKCATVALLIAGAINLGCQAWRQNFRYDSGGVPYCDSVKNPYVYSQTSPDIFRLMQTVDGLARASQAHYDTVVEVMSPESYWPLPWYLRRFKQVGYWDKIPDQPLAPIMIVSTALHANFDDRPAKTHLMAGYFELRPKVFFELYVSVDLWSRYIKTLPPEKD